MKYSKIRVAAEIKMSILQPSCKSVAQLERPTPPQALPHALNFQYQVKMYAPDPRGVDVYFTYDGRVSRSARIDNGRQFDSLLQGLADHIFAHSHVRIHPDSIVNQFLELLAADDSET